jgi:ABC-type transporter Mla maintaining outer membrane lipid asymmetry ATPase subunit MlaF
MIEENIALPLSHCTNLAQKEIADLVSDKLALVQLRGCEDRYLFELFGRMKKRIG